MKKSFIVLLFVGLCIFNADAQKKIPHSLRLESTKTGRTEIILPQVNGFNCYKADFHVHTSYSDGNVTPAGRVTEAWHDGLDIIAITDHYEALAGVKKFFNVAAKYHEGTDIKYQSARQAKGIKADFNAMHQEAVNQLEKSKYPMLLIKGCEMGRNAKTHGHFNALFLEDINTVYDPDMAEAFRKVKKQNGFIIHNHPAWRRDTSDKTEFHEQVYSEGLIDGIEVVNNKTFYPHIVRRCIDEKLTMFANTDIHGLTSLTFTGAKCHRTMTLVFAKEMTEQAIKEALLKHRTIAYAMGCLIGEESWLKDFLNAAINCRMIQEDENGRRFMLTNMSSITYKLRKGKNVYELEPFTSITISCNKDKESGKYTLPKFRIENMWIADYHHPTFEIEMDK